VKQFVREMGADKDKVHPEPIALAGRREVTDRRQDEVHPRRLRAAV